MVAQLSMNRLAWKYFFSTGMPANPASHPDGWKVDVPSSGSVNMLVQRLDASIASRDEIKVTAKVLVSSGARFVCIGENRPYTLSPRVRFYIDTDETHPATEPGARYWSKPSRAIVLEDADDKGFVAYRIPLVPEEWSGEESTANFRGDLEKCVWLGMVFGGGETAGHGLRMAEGTCRIIVSDFSLVG